MSSLGEEPLSVLSIDQCRCYKGSRCICACASDQQKPVPETKSITTPIPNQSALAGGLNVTYPNSSGMDACSQPEWDQQSHGPLANETRGAISIDTPAAAMSVAEAQDFTNSQTFSRTPEFMPLHSSTALAPHMSGNEGPTGFQDWHNMDNFANLYDFTNSNHPTQTHGLDDAYQTAHAPDFIDAQVFADTYNMFTTADFASFGSETDMHHLESLQDDTPAQGRDHDVIFTTWD